ncbi:MAG: endonuclease [Bacteroidales bacterium]|nr:endonuclease [Bacteroidales bacterium]
MKKSLLCSLAAVCAAATFQLGFAEIPAGYYNSLDGKKDAELKTATYQVIHNLTRISSYNDLPKYFQVTDVYPESNRWWDMYSDIPLYAPSFSGLNREHAFPKSWWGGLTDVNAYVDLNHLYPSEMAANTAKSNYPLGEVDMSYTPNFDNGMSIVGYAVSGQGGGAKYVFEPADEYKGDFARTYFYMVTCYQDYTWKTSYMYMLQQNTYPTLKDWAIDLLLKWSREDPVSDKEVQRNEKVWGFQNNRNPFIDFPLLAEYIWGNKKGEAFDISLYGVNPGDTGEPSLVTPVQDMALDFSQVAVGGSVDAKLYFKGENLTGSLSLSIYSGDKGMFSLSQKSIDASLVNAEEGYWLTVTYSPTEVGTHQSKLLISDGGLVGSRGVYLIGECLEVPTLSACTALAATDITEDSYVANWTTPDDVVDYYVVTRNRYVGGAVTTEELLAEETSLEIDEFDLSDSESYSVQSVRLGYKSEPSNVIFVEHAGISSVLTNQPISAIGVEGAVMISTSTTHTNCVIYDASGRTVSRLPSIAGDVTIPLPRGFYFGEDDPNHPPNKNREK